VCGVVCVCVWCGVRVCGVCGVYVCLCKDRLYPFIVFKNLIFMINFI